MPMSSSEDLPGKDFERQVADAYRTLGYQVTSNIRLPGQQTDLIARRDGQGGLPSTLAVECKDHQKAVDNQEVQDFVSSVITRRDAKTITGGVMVSRNGFTADARAAASDSSSVVLLSWEELTSQIFDIRHQLRKLVRNYESSDIYGYYLPLDIESSSWSNRGGTYRKASLDKLLARWTRKPDNPAGVTMILALADFGSGKTTLLRSIEYDRAKAHLAGEDLRVPLFVSLREYMHSQDIPTLLRASFRDAYRQDLPTELIWQRMEEGQLYLLLDGFDEMVERSDPGRRLELFHALVPILRSESPAILTSRPSYLVERDELDELLAELRIQESAISGPTSAAGNHQKVRADRLGRKLVDRHREVHPSPGDISPIGENRIQVIQLLALDEERIKEFVTKHAADLETVGASPEDLIEFIGRTYDLTDLASRPILLDLIISSVVMDGLDISDTEAEYGASGLYEIYTDSKLRLDLAKGQVRRHGLSLSTRRLLSEELALKLYRANQLEIDFADVVDDLSDRSPALREALENSGMSERQIATDFATCSFITLDQSGKCRFVHKSFRGFFVARRLMSELSTRNPLLADPLDREVLYFLGGFAPTEPRVGDELWSMFKRASSEQTVLKRNLLVAYLYTKPKHDTRKIADAEISDAGFGRLFFDGTRVQGVAWRKCTLGSLKLDSPSWSGTKFEASHIKELHSSGGSLDLTMERTNVDAWRASQTKVRARVVDSTIDSLSLGDCEVELQTDRSRLGVVRASNVRLKHIATGRTSGFEELRTSNSFIRLAGRSAPARMSARNCVIDHGASEFPQRAELTDCLLRLEVAPAYLPAHPGALEMLFATGTILLAPNGISATFLEKSLGVFGSIGPSGGRRPISRAPAAWGVLEADDFLRELALPDGARGCKLGNLLLVTREFYDDRVSMMSHRLAVAVEAEGLPDLGKDPAGLPALLRTARELYAQLGKESWLGHDQVGLKLESQ